MSWSRPLDEGFEPLFEQLGKDSPKSPVLSGTFELVTPMIGGGAEAGKVDLDDPIRTSEIVGSLRECFRLACGHEFVAYETLAAAESEIFGGVGSAGQSHTPALVRVEVVADDSKRETRPSVYRKLDRSIPNFVGGILIQGRDDKIEHLVPGVTVQVTLIVSPSLSREHLPRLMRTWQAFSLMAHSGARVSRGAGTLVPQEGIKRKVLLDLVNPSTEARDFPTLRGAKAFILRDKLGSPRGKEYEAAWFTAVNCYQMLSRGITIDSACERLGELVENPLENFWEGHGPDEGGLRHTTWKDSKRSIHDGLGDTVFAPRAQFGLPRSHGDGKPTLHTAERSRKQSLIWTRPVKLEDRVYPMILVLNGLPVRSSEVMLENARRDRPINVDLVPDRSLLDEEFKTGLKLTDLCRRYFTALGFEEVK